MVHAQAIVQRRPIGRLLKVVTLGQNLTMACLRWNLMNALKCTAAARNQHLIRKQGLFSAWSHIKLND
jgi:hypothetical protein